LPPSYFSVTWEDVVSRVRFTEKSLAKLRAPDPSGRQRLYWDAGLPGFGLLVSGVSDARTWIVKAAGKRRKIGRADVMPLDAARADARKAMLGLAAGIDPRAKPASAATLGEIAAGYVASASLRPRTAESYRGTVAHCFSDWVDRPIGGITREMVEKRHRAIAAEVEARDRAAIAKHAAVHRRRSERTAKRWPEASARHRALFEAAKAREPRSGHAVANGAMRVLRLLWNFAADKDPSLVGQNPVRLRKQWFKVARREDLVKSDDLAKFYAAVTALPNPVQRDFLLLALHTGARRRELAGLAWNDVDFKAGVIRLPAATTKSGRKLDLPMSDFVRDLLVARRALGNARFVFPANSKSRHIEEPKSALAEVAAASGVRVSCHGLRRTFVSIAESCDISPIALKALVNHAIGGDITSGYVIISTSRLKEAAQKVCDRLKTLCGIAEPAGRNVARLRRRENRDA
jgi:integrase